MHTHTHTHTQGVWTTKSRPASLLPEECKKRKLTVSHTRPSPHRPSRRPSATPCALTLACCCGAKDQESRLTELLS